MKRDFIIFLLIIISYSCSESTYPKISQAGFYPDIYSAKPLTVLIMPVINRTNNTIDEDFITSTNSVMLAERGYYVMPSLIIHDYIKHDSLECLPDIDPVPCHVFHERFGVDALFFIAVKNWQRDFASSGLHEEFEYSLVSASTGKELWYYDIYVSKDREVNVPVTNDDNGSFWANLCCGIMGSLFASAVATAMTSYKLTAEQTSQMALQNLPAGRYHSRYLLDSLDQVKVNTIWKNQKFGDRLPLNNQQ
jgi:hypothetical protein